MCNCKENRIRGVIITLGLICLIFDTHAQDIHFTQFFANKLYLSPSFTGATAQNRIISAYRNQWPGVDGFVTYSTSIDHYFSNFNSGVGILVMRDAAGAGSYGTLSLGASYSYVFKFKEGLHIRPGVSFSYLQRSIDFSKLILGDQLTHMGINPTSIRESSGFEKVSALDAASSVIFYTKDFWAGTTFDHLLNPKVSIMKDEERLPLKYSIYGGVTVIRKGRLLKPIDETLSFAFLFSGQSKYRQLDIGAYWARIPLIFGIWYRGIPVLNSERGDSFAFLTGIKTNKFSVGYSYDFTVSNLINHTRGAHEITLNLEFSKVRRRKLQMIPCPEF